MAYEELKKVIGSSKRIVFFGGAGVSTESGLPDFRGVDGLYRKKYDYPPEVILSHDFFMSHPAEFYAFYRDKLLVPGIKPNRAHYALAKLEREGALSAVVTQNIDGLHQAAGSRNVLELHGSTLRNHCMKCGKKYGPEVVADAAGDGVPRCVCGGIIRPDVVLYDEQLDEAVMNRAADAIARADLLIIGGTSLAVYPAAGLIGYFSGEHLALINKTVTPADGMADIIVRAPIGAVLGETEGID